MVTHTLQHNDIIPNTFQYVSMILSFTVTNAPCANGELRLQDGNREDQGRVEICLGGRWTSVCGDLDWDKRDAQVVCRQLGYTEGSECLSAGVWLFS